MTDICLGQEEKSCEDVTKRGVNQNCSQAHGRDPWPHFCRGIAVLGSGLGVNGVLGRHCKSPKRTHYVRKTDETYILLTALLPTCSL